MKTIEELEAQLTAISEQIKELKNKPKFEVGKWVKVIDGKNGAYGCNGNIGMVINSPLIEPENLSGVLFENAKFFIQLPCGKIWSFRNGVVVEPATLEEVYAALVKEAEKRGFKEGVRVVTCLGNSGKLDCSKPFYNINDNKLRWADSEDAMNNIVFDNGQWATIIKDDVIKVGSYEVKKKGSQYEIGCKQVSWNLIDTIRIEMKRNNFKKVSFDGIETDLETIEKILNL